jgi:heat shock protein HslJ
MFRYATILTISLLLAGAIFAQKTPGSNSSEPLNGTWYLIPSLPSDTAAGRIPTISFNPKTHKFTGNSGCNSMRGDFQSADSSLKFSEQIILGKMACPGFNEAAFIKNLINTNRFSIKDGELILMFDETVISRWSRTPVKQVRMYKA